MSKRMGIIGLVIVLLLFSATVMGSGDVKEIKVFFEKIEVVIDGLTHDMESPPFIYNDRVYVPVRFIAEGMGGDVTWDGETKQVFIKSYKGFDDCDTLNGETFVYGMVIEKDDEKRQLKIEQHFDDNSIEVTPLLDVREDAVILLERNDKKMNLDFEDIKPGDTFGLILDRDGKVRGMVITF